MGNVGCLTATDMCVCVCVPTLPFTFTRVCVCVCVRAGCWSSTLVPPHLHYIDIDCYKLNCRGNNSTERTNARVG